MKIFCKRISQGYLLIWVSLTLLWKVTGILSPMNPSTENILLSPSFTHIFGTDALGRDLAGRILEGGFVSLVVSLFASSLSLLVAVLVGVVWTWFKPKDFFVLLLLMDLLQAIPSYITSTLIFILIQSTSSSPSGTIVALVFALALTHWMTPARILRGRTLQLQSSTFIEASRGMGATHWHLLRTHLSSHIKDHFLILWAMQLPILLMYESFMSFIGFGIESPYTSWGLLLQDGWRFLGDYPHLLLGPGLVLFTVLLAANYLFDQTRKQDDLNSISLNPKA